MYLNQGKKPSQPRKHYLSIQIRVSKHFHWDVMTASFIRMKTRVSGILAKPILFLVAIISSHFSGRLSLVSTSERIKIVSWSVKPCTIASYPRPSTQNLCTTFIGWKWIYVLEFWRATFTLSSLPQSHSFNKKIDCTEKRNFRTCIHS